MFRPRVIPILLLKDNGLVKTVKFKNPIYIGDPINAIRIFNDLEADELIVLDIGATRQQRSISTDLVMLIGEEAYMPFAVGGGIRSVKQIEQLIYAGAEKVVLNSVTVSNPYLVKSAVELVGSQSIVVSIDAKRSVFGGYRVCTESGKKVTKIDPVEHAKRVVDLGAGEVLINSVDKDGMMTGYDIDLIGRISDAVKVPVVACGGAGKNADLSTAVSNGGASAVAAGSMFVFYGPRKAVLVNYPKRSVLNSLFHD